MRNWVTCIFLGFLILASNSLHARTIIKSCNNCSSVGYKNTAQAEIIHGTKVVIVDAVKSNISAYTILRTKVDDGTDVSVASQVAVPEDIKIAFKEAITYKNQYINDFKSEFNSEKISYNAIQADILSNSNPVNNTAPNQSKPINGFDFMANSALRRQVFERITKNYPNYIKFNEYWNKTVGMISISFGGEKANISADLEILTLNPTLKFEDGSYVIAQYNMDNNTLDVKLGVDQAGNNIPMDSDASIGGIYNIRNSSHLSEIQEYMSYYWLIDFKNAPHGQSCTMKCKPTSNVRYECTYGCK